MQISHLPTKRSTAIFLLVIAFMAIVSWGELAMHHSLSRSMSAMTVPVPGCGGQASTATCLETHLGTLEQMTQFLPQKVFSVLSALLVLLFAVFTGLAIPRPPQYSRWRYRWRETSLPCRASILDWLTLHEKRDPAAALLCRSAAAGP